jgi:hypothetical protein
LILGPQISDMGQARPFYVDADGRELWFPAEYRACCSGKVPFWPPEVSVGSDQAAFRGTPIDAYSLGVMAAFLFLGRDPSEGIDELQRGR